MAHYSKPRLPLPLILTFIVALVLSACAAPAATPAPQATAAPTGPRTGGEAIIGSNADIISFNGNLASFVNYPVFRQCYNRLVKFDHDMVLQPELATAWSWSDDGLTLTLELRQGVLFHNGREFVADDVVQNIRFAQVRETGGNMFPRVQTITNVEALDDYTVAITFSAVNPVALDTLDSISIMAPESFDTVGQGCIGTGPFKFVEWVPGDRVVFERNENYWREGLPYLDKITFKPYTDAEALSTALESGLIDGAIVLPYRDYERLQAVADIDLGYPGSLLYVLMLNPPDPGQPDHPLSNKLVRQAIHYAVDRQAMIEQALFGVGEATQLPFPKTSLAYFDDLADTYTYDLDRARELLAEAGYADGFDIEIIGNTSFPEMVDMSQILRADLEAIGIRASIVPLESAVWTPRLLGGEYQSTFTFVGRGHKDPLGLFDNSPFRIANSPVWPAGDFPEGYVENLQIAMTNVDRDIRREAFRQVQEIMLDQAVQIPLSWRFTLFGSQRTFHGMTHTVDDEIELERAWKE